MSSVGVIGAGYWGPNLIRNMVVANAFDQVIVCDSDGKRLQAVCAQIPGVKGYGHAGELFTNAEVQAVVIATPVRTHFELAKAALMHGKHVLIEKPMTQTSAQARELIALAEAKGLTLMVDHTFLFTGAVEKMLDIVGGGGLGECYYVDSVRVNLGLFQRDVNVIWDLAPHDLSIVSHILRAKPRVVRAIGRSHSGHGMVDVAYLNVEYREGFSAYFNLSWLSPTKIRRMTVAGSKRMLVWDDMETTEKLRVYDKGIELHRLSEDDKRSIRVEYRTGDVWLPKLDVTEALRKMTGHFIACCRERTRPICGGNEGLEVVRVLEASQMSLDGGGRAVALDDELPNSRQV
jgi:predicted dehydrogenase